MGFYINKVIKQNLIVNNIVHTCCLYIYRSICKLVRQFADCVFFVYLTFEFDKKCQ